MDPVRPFAALAGRLNDWPGPFNAAPTAEQTGLRPDIQALDDSLSYSPVSFMASALAKDSEPRAAFTIRRGSISDDEFAALSAPIIVFPDHPLLPEPVLPAQLPERPGSARLDRATGSSLLTMGRTLFDQLGRGPNLVRDLVAPNPYP